MENSAFRDAIKSKYPSEASFAIDIGWTPQKLSKTICGKYIPKISEAVKISKRLQISLSEFANFFDG